MVSFISFVSSLLCLARGCAALRQSPAIYIRNQCFILNSGRSLIPLPLLTAFRRWNQDLSRPRISPPGFPSTRAAGRYVAALKENYDFFTIPISCRSWNNFKTLLTPEPTPPGMGHQINTDSSHLHPLPLCINFNEPRVKSSLSPCAFLSQDP